MKPFNGIHRSIYFETLRSRENFFHFTMKCLFYIIPAVILGNYTDTTIKTMKNKELGYNNYINVISNVTICTQLY